MFKNALVSVSDKTGLDTFLAPLVEKGLRVVSSGGTAKFLEEKGIPVVKVSDQTQFPEVMGGRVKTLHPFIHMPLLYRENVEDDVQMLKTYNLQPFDLVVVNLYPFAAGLAQGKNSDEMTELIDIGGPTLLRASAKNFKSICVVCDPNDYKWIAEKGEVHLPERRELAAKVFSHVSQYDQKISQYLQEASDRPFHSLEGQLRTMLRYGENPQQEGYWYELPMGGLHKAKVIQGKPLSYNNLLDLDGACRTLNLFSEPTVISVKHNNPCGAASDIKIHSALLKSLKADPVSVFGGIIAANREIDGDCAEELCKIFLECVIAPSYTDEAYKVFAKKKNLRVLEWGDLRQPQDRNHADFRSIWGGYLVQTADDVAESEKDWKFVGKTASESEMEEIKFAWRVCASLKSNAIAICGHRQSLGLGMGQVNRVDAVRQAIDRARQFHGEASEWILASDAFFPFPDSIEVAADAGIQWIIQPGGSVKDDEVIEAAKRRGVNMVLTGHRHFRH